MEEPGEAASLGSSLLVPSVQELAKDSLTTVPPRYLRPEQDPPFSSQSTSQTPLPHIPVIDFHCLLSGDGMESELEKLHHACKEWGFFQIVTNGDYRSIEHRAVVNSVKERLSIATFYSPKLEGDIGPAPCLVTPHSPALLKNVSVADYMKGVFSRELRGRSYLDVLKIDSEAESN